MIKAGLMECIHCEPGLTLMSVYSKLQNGWFLPNMIVYSKLQNGWFLPNLAGCCEPEVLHLGAGTE